MPFPSSLMKFQFLTFQSDHMWFSLCLIWYLPEYFRSRINTCFPCAWSCRHVSLSGKAVRQGWAIYESTLLKLTRRACWATTQASWQVICCCLAREGGTRQQGGWWGANSPLELIWCTCQCVCTALTFTPPCPLPPGKQQQPTSWESSIVGGQGEEDMQSKNSHKLQSNELYMKQQQQQKWTLI